MNCGGNRLNILTRQAGRVFIYGPPRYEIMLFNGFTQLTVSTLTYDVP